MNWSAVEVTEIPRAFSISIQSDTVERRPALPWMAPASEITLACRAKASVNVDFPASGWLMTAKVRRRATSRPTVPSARLPPMAASAVGAGWVCVTGGPYPVGRVGSRHL